MQKGEGREERRGEEG
jgi:hypothetical protein